MPAIDERLARLPAEARVEAAVGTFGLQVEPAEAAAQGELLDPADQSGADALIAVRRGDDQAAQPGSAIGKDVLHFMSLEDHDPDGRAIR
jgi:hypothetical protein